ncbi:MAG TPA: cupredoxin domain-containing protein [bacterium]|nr:cupredoxin domain-containing protein [bacterium]
MWRLLIVIAILGLSVAGAPVMPTSLDASEMLQTAWRWSTPPPEIFRPVPDRQGLRLRMIDFAFRPSVLQAAQGVPIVLELINSGATPHILLIPVLGVRETLLPGERQIVYLGRAEAGIYEFFCAIPEHRDAGMIGRLIVGPGIVAR